MGSTQMVLGALTLLILAAATGSVTAAAEPAVSASASTRVLVARLATVDFKSKRVGTENYKRTKITNSGPVTVSLLVSAGLSGVLGFGLMPGSTCPVLAPAPMAPGDGCYAVVRFAPTELFVAWQAEGSLLATATDPNTAAVVDEISIPVLGRAVL